MKTQIAIRLLFVTAAIAITFSAGSFYYHNTVQHINTTYSQVQNTKTPENPVEKNLLIIIAEEERIAFLFTHEHENHENHLFHFTKLRSKKHFPVTRVIAAKLVMILIHILMIASLLPVIH